MDKKQKAVDAAQWLLNQRHIIIIHPPDQFGVKVEVRLGENDLLFSDWGNTFEDAMLKVASRTYRYLDEQGWILEE